MANSLRIILLILALSFPGVLVELLICFFTKHRAIKYIFPAIALVLSAAFIIYAKVGNLEGLGDLGYIFLSVTAFSMFVITAVIGVVFDLIQYKKHEKKDSQPSNQPQQ